MRPRKPLLIECIEYARDVALLIVVTFSLAVICAGIVTGLERIFA